MDIILSIFICLLLLAIVYLVLNHKIIHSVDQIFRNRYQNQLKTDVQEFYRELENYAVIFENRVQRFKSLLERQEVQIKSWENILSNVKTTKKAKEILEIVKNTIEANTTEKPQEKNEIKSKNLITEEVKKDKTIQMSSPKENFAESIILDTPDKLYSEAKFYDLSSGSTFFQKNKSLTPPKRQFIETSKLNKKGMKNLQDGDGFQKKEIAESTVTKFFGRLGGSISKSFLEETKNKDQNSFKRMVDGQIPSVEEEEFKKELLNKEEVVHLIQDLSDKTKKPMALKVLIKSGFSVFDISEMSEISYSELEATRSIHGF